MSKDKRVVVASTDTPTLYDPLTDKIRPVTQEDIDKLLKVQAQARPPVTTSSISLSPVQIRRLAIDIWGKGWAAALAARSGRSVRTVEKWFSDESPIPPNIGEILRLGALTRERELAQIVLSLSPPLASYQQMDSTGPFKL